MTTIEQKKAEVEKFLSERDALKRLKLEESILGKRKRSEWILPITLTVLSIGGILLLGMSGALDVSAAVVVVLVLIATNAWHQLEFMTTQKQIKALKEYLDLQTAEMVNRK